MSGKKISQQHHATFDGIRHSDDDGNEYWRARQLAKVLEYSEYRHFLPVIQRAKIACRNSGQPESDHFEDILDMVEIGSGAQRPVEDVRVRRDEIEGKRQANQTHFEVGRKVRQTIQDLGGTMPERLPVPDQSIQQLESAKKKQIKKTRDSQ